MVHRAAYPVPTGRDRLIADVHADPDLSTAMDPCIVIARPSATGSVSNARRKRVKAHGILHHNANEEVGTAVVEVSAEGAGVAVAHPPRIALARADRQQ